jgi:hypothetical protein
VVDVDFNIVYSGDAQVEFQPDPARIGYLKAISPVGLFPDITAETYTPQYGSRPSPVATGLTFTGVDASGVFYKWMMDSAATNFISYNTERANGYPG